MLTEQEITLVKVACDARKKAYAPYSHFTVGAALLDENGYVFCGFNIENASYGATICAERVAFSHALSENARNFKAIAIAGGKESKNADACFPCGICRQVMAEFCQTDFRIIIANQENPQASTVKTLGELFPSSFDGASL